MSNSPLDVTKTEDGKFTVYIVLNENSMIVKGGISRRDIELLKVKIENLFRE